MTYFNNITSITFTLHENAFFGIKIKQNFTNSIEDQRPWSVFL